MYRIDMVMHNKFKRFLETETEMQAKDIVEGLKHLEHVSNVVISEVDAKIIDRAHPKRPFLYQKRQV